MNVGKKKDKDESGKNGECHHFLNFAFQFYTNKSFYVNESIRELLISLTIRLGAAS